MSDKVRFTALMPNLPPPSRADSSLAGTVPLRAYRFCEPFVQANGFGWFVYSPIDFRVVWDGSEFLWRPRELTSWHPLVRAQVPGYAQWVKDNAPPQYQNLEVPFLSAFPERGVLQIWSGFAVKTPDQWSLLIRGPANVCRTQAYFHLEGIVEHDWWPGPLLGNLQFLKAGQEARFGRQSPLFLVQPIPRQAYSSSFLDHFDVRVDTTAVTSDHWEEVHRAVFFDADEKPLGAYARVARKRES